MLPPAQHQNHPATKELAGRCEDIANLLQHCTTKLELLARLWLGDEARALIEPNGALVASDDPEADCLVPFRTNLLRRGQPQQAASACRPERGLDVDSPDLGTVRGRAFVTRSTKGDEADNLARIASDEQMRRLPLEHATPQGLTPRHGQGSEVRLGQDALVGMLPRLDVRLRDGATVFRSGGLNLHAG